MIHHAYTAYTPADPDTLRRHLVAQSTWKRQPWAELPIADGDVPRLWKERDKLYPYLKDVFDLAVEGLNPEDIVVYTNCDIMVRGDCCARIAEALQDADACYAFRRDFHHRVEKPIPDSDYSKGLNYPGSDLVAFRAVWWQAYRDDMPDMLLAAEAWDPVMRTLIEETNAKESTMIENIICHERHSSFWENPAHRYKLGMQLHNLALAKRFFLARGINPGVFGIP